jgi:hypothetical protein
MRWWSSATADEPDPSNSPSYIESNFASTEVMIPVIYGQVQVGGNDVYMKSPDLETKYLWIVQTLSEGECDSIYAEDGIDQLFLDDKIYTEYGFTGLGELVFYRFHNGSVDQTYDVTLNSASEEWIDPLKHVCYIVWRLEYNENYFTSFPTRKVILKGKKVYDLRDDTTAYSNNPVLCLYDYITNPRYGMSLDSSKIDTTSWESAANYCDTKGWGFNASIRGNESAAKIISKMLLTFRGTLVWYDDKFYLRYADTNYESSSMTLTDSHIVQDTNGKDMVSISQPGQVQTPDMLRIKYIEPDKQYAMDSIMIGDATGVVQDFNLTGITDHQHASDIGVYNLERLQLNRVISGTFRDDALKLEPHDIVTFNSSALSISNQTMRVINANIIETGLINLSLMYEEDSLYDDDYDSDIEDIYNCTLPDPKDEPPSVSNGTMVEETYNYRLRSFTRLNISFTAPANYPWVDHYQIFLSYDNSNWEALFNIAADSAAFSIDPVEEGNAYYVRIKTVSIWGVKQQDNNDYKLYKTVTGYGDPPQSLTSLTASVNQNTINLWADKVNDPDIEAYEFRTGTSWNAAIFLASLRLPNMSLSGVKPGGHTFIANTLGNNGLYGVTPQSDTVTLIDPPKGWTVQATITDDYDGP